MARQILAQQLFSEQTEARRGQVTCVLAQVVSGYVSMQPVKLTSEPTCPVLWGLLGCDSGTLSCAHQTGLMGGKLETIL